MFLSAVVRHPAQCAALAIALTSLPAAGQSAGRCFVAADSQRELRARDGSKVILNPEAMVVRGDTTVILGSPTALFAPRAVGGEGPTHEGFSGVEIHSVGGPIALIPSPPGIDGAKYFRASAGGSGVDAVFFVSDSGQAAKITARESGTFWYGKVTSRRWTGIQRIGRLEDVVAHPNLSSQLAKSGDQLRFAVAFGDPSASGGVIVWRRDAALRWHVDTLPLQYGPMSVTLDVMRGPARPPHVYADARLVEKQTTYVGSLYVANTALPSRLRPARRNAGESMNEPAVLVTDSGRYVSWWSFPASEWGRPSLWTQRLAESGATNGTAAQLVAEDVSSFIALPGDIGDRHGLAWIYRRQHSADTVEVSALVDGKPRRVGRIPFSDGLLMNGAATGPASFILSTAARPTKGSAPQPASRVIRFRLACGQATSSH